MRMLVVLELAGACCIVSSPAAAQGVFDMGQLTGTLSQDAVTKSERTRAARTPRRTSARKPRNTDPRVAYNCTTMLPRYRKRFGPTDPQIVKLARLCRGLGY